MGFLYTKSQCPRGSAPRGPLPACRFPFRPGPRRSKLFFFDGEKRQAEYNVPQGGGVAQLGEHHVRNVGVEGSIPFSSTIFFFPSVHLFFLSVGKRSHFPVFCRKRIVCRVRSAAASCVLERRSTSAASEGGSVRGSPCIESARLRFTSLRPSSCGCCAYSVPRMAKGIGFRNIGGGHRSWLAVR
jgi:hypothetical protein